MISPSRIFGALCATAVVACLMACGVTGKMKEAAERQKRMNDLKQVAIAFHNFEQTNNGFPPDQPTFVAWAQKMEPESAAIVQSGKYTFVYAKVRSAEVTEGLSNVVMGYDNQLLPSGRIVVMADGGTRMMSEPEFQGAPRLKAKK